MRRKLRSKFFANRGVARNKKPLQNKLYWVHFLPLEKVRSKMNNLCERRVFKNLFLGGVEWAYEQDFNQHGRSFHDLHISVASLKRRLGLKQWAKLCNGKRFFILQRRFDHKNKATTM